MRSLLKIFFSAPGARPWLSILALLAATLAEGFGFATLLPLIGLAAETPAEDRSPLNRMVRQLLAELGLPLEVGTLLVVVVAILILRSALRFAAMVYVGNAMATVTTGVRRRLIDRLLRVRWRFMVHMPLGRIANVASGEAMKAGRAFTLVAELLGLLIQSAVMAVIAFFISWKIALAATAIGGGVALALAVLVRRSRRTGRKQTARTKDLLVFLSDTLGNLKTVRAMAREPAFARLFEERIRRLHKTIRRQVINREALNNLQDALFALALGVGFWVAFAIWQIPVAELVVVGIVLFRSVSSIGKLQKAYQAAVENEASWYHCERLIAEASADPEPNPGRLPARLERAITFERVRFRYGDETVLDGLDLEIPAGSLTVLTGPSGAGKTTIVDLVLGLHRPDGGRIAVDGVDLAEIDLVSWRKMIGYVPQEAVLFHDTIRANLALGDEGISEAELRAALEIAEAWDFVASLPRGLDTVVGERGARLSGGQRQRIALARALLGRPRLLVLDEVTSALDPVTATEIARNVRRLAGGLTILAVTHRPEFLDLADRIYRVEHGSAALARATRARATAEPA
ncbi:MAG: ABC transporter ATP-binding protein/permease [Geminicoccaceae bacterium]|nr:ABC transporter ATP-binding protein/permease [Geminicoccaceae bacterium]MCS7267324.1 ABC transporter ATP-binding protein/permease [Geminicoccaceae bacterium]MCX7630958.1 ABC transporter ATP-binding protein/permease [Geminicoccaceae bacterium]MDW8125089.1 ABC transporter ATP-binding protein [Geminicoccaceae bacterium]MDW8340623.1 ABC transporter ATP-binding protein [Geminicoccaceae bacterium]